MKIVFLDSNTLGKEVDLSPIEKGGTFINYSKTTPEEVFSRVKEAEVLIVNKVKVGKEEIDAAPELKLICVAATGTNNIDLDYAQSRGVEVKNVVNYSTESVAQVTFAALLSLLNNIAYYDNVVKSGLYSKSPHFTHTEKTFFELKGKNFGIVGMGNIGKRVASIAKEFGCNLFYYSTSGTAHYKEYPSLSLVELLEKSDILSIHAPLNEKTKNLITLDELKKMKREALLVNMGRGGIVNESHLAEALDCDIIAGAVIDVYESEPIPENHPYLNMKQPQKVILTPHIAWASSEAKKNLVEQLADNINLYFK